MTANEATVEGSEDESVGLACTLDMFREQDQVKGLIDAISHEDQTQFGAERAFEEMKRILDLYQEQPHLLDPHLEGILGQLTAVVRDPALSSPARLQAFKYAWLVVKVRGYKNIARKLPHEVKDLLPVLQLLETPEAEGDFYASYVLLLWLSIIVYMPFNMTGFDQTTAGTTSEGGTVLDRMMAVIKTHLKSAQKSREMAAYLASRFVTRPDLRDNYLQAFIDYCFEALEGTTDSDVHSVFHKLGVLRALGLIFKHGKREELLPYSRVVLSRLVKSQHCESQDTPIRRLVVKLIQRIGLTFQKPRVAAWRYQRGNRSLSINIHGQDLANLQGKNEELEEEDEDEEEVEPEVEEVIDSLLQNLRYEHTVVRWSAAKGIGRVTGRLPRECGDEVVGALFDLFSSRESDTAWHGGCLALAELARRGLLLPSRLAAVVPILQKALIYDEIRGQCSVGSNIRDAACYLCWAFARAYHPDQLRPYMHQFATGLLIVTLFDREIPCRRAASAAFQEHVGRQGTFPHGIEILTTVDYFAVGNRTNAFLNLAVQVGQHPEYTRALVDHLLEKKVNHWDSAIRELTAKALHNLTPLDPEYLRGTVLPRLLEQTSGSALVVRHGAILAVAEITHSLALVARTKGVAVEDFIGAGTVSGIRDIVGTLESRKLYRGLGGEYMRQATALLVNKCSLASLPFHGHHVLDQWQNLLEESIVYVDENIRQAALDALPPFWSTYVRKDVEGDRLKAEALVKRYAQGLNTEKENQSLGFAAALGCLPQHMIKGQLGLVTEALTGAMEISPATATWALTRKEAIQSILKVVHTVGISSEKECKKGCEQVCGDGLSKLYRTLVRALDDYTMDRRGDIGAWVREAAMTGLLALTDRVMGVNPDLLVAEEVEEVVARVCQQAVERIDRTRKVAGKAFATLLYRSPRIPHIPHRSELEHIFPEQECERINWAAEGTTFPLFIRLLDLPALRRRVLLGTTYAAGGISANLSRYAGTSLREYLNQRASQREQLKVFIATLLEVFETFQKVDRITLPLLKTMGDLLCSCAVLDEILEEDNTYASQLVTLVKKECLRCTDYHKLAAAIAVLCELLRIEGPSAKACLTQVSLFLGYQYPKVRAVTATSFLTALQDYCERDIVPPENLDEVMAVLEETEWMEDMEEARKQRNRLCALMGVPVPQPKKK